MTTNSGALPLSFHPTSIQQLLALHIARRFSDLRRLPQYLEACQNISAPEAATFAREAHAAAQTSEALPAELFFKVVRERRHP